MALRESYNVLSTSALLDLIESCDGWDDDRSRHFRESLISLRVGRIFKIADMLSNKPICAPEDPVMLTRILCARGRWNTAINALD